MFEKTYIRKPRTVRAIQYDGTDDIRQYIRTQYGNISCLHESIYFTGDYVNKPIYIGDWLIIERGDWVRETIDRDDFEEEYEPE